MKTFAVVTVCYNAENEINETIESVLKQTLKDYEYLIIDGNSTDTTIEVIDGYKECFKKRYIDFKILSEPDTGIYNAMNKAIDVCQAKYVIFLNSGDCFVTDKVLETVNKYLDSKHLIYYGDVISISEHNYNHIEADNIDEITWHLPFCHQCVFTSLALLKKYKFNEKYRICADYDQFLRIYNDLKAEIFKKIDVDVSYYKDGGYSARNNGVWSRIEMNDIRKENDRIDLFMFYLVKVKLLIKKFLILAFNE